MRSRALARQRVSLELAEGDFFSALGLQRWVEERLRRKDCGIQGLWRVCGKGTLGLGEEGERRIRATEETWGWHWVLVHERWGSLSINLEWRAAQRLSRTQVLASDVAWQRPGREGVAQRACL